MDCVCTTWDGADPRRRPSSASTDTRRALKPLAAWPGTSGTASTSSSQTCAVKGSPAPRLDFWAILQHLPCPTLVVWGTNSDVLSEAQARRMVEVLPVGELLPVPGVAHAPALIEPVVLAALDGFLGGPG